VATSLAGEFPGSAVAAGSVAEVAEGADAVVTMLPACAQVKETYLGPGGLLKTAAPGTLMVDCSTVAPSTSQEVAEAAASRGVVFADAPVSGGVGAAEAATLTFMVGSDDAAAFDRASALLQMMGKNVVRCGGAGSGSAAKLCNNLALAIQMIGTSEALGLAARLGVKPEVMAGIMSTATARCWSIDTYPPCPGLNEAVPSSKGYAGGFGVNLMSKDLQLALSESQRVGVNSLPLGEGAAALYRALSATDMGTDDFSVVFKHLYPEIVEERTGGGEADAA